MSEKPIEKPSDENFKRDAVLKMSLEANSGYSAKTEHEISADQWRRILMIAEEA